MQKSPSPDRISIAGILITRKKECLKISRTKTSRDNDESEVCVLVGSLQPCQVCACVRAYVRVCVCACVRVT